MSPESRVLVWASRLEATDSKIWSDILRISCGAMRTLELCACAGCENQGWTSQCRRFFCGKLLRA